MFLKHFGLATNPFGISPHLDFLYKSTAFEESMAHLVYGLDNSEAIVMITGPIGTGKTMAVQSFLNNLGASFSSALVTNTRVNSVELLKLILEDLGVSYLVGSDKSDLLILFKDFLISESSAGRKVLIVIDEAQNLERDVLEEIRLLTNLGQGQGQPVQLILLGQPELAANVNEDGLAQLRQRIRIHYHLDTLTRDEVEEYVNHRMLVAGCDRALFNKQALEKISHYSGGVPRLVNSLAGNGLLSAYVDGRTTIEGNDIDPDELIGVRDVVGEVAKAPVSPIAKPVASTTESGPPAKPSIQYAAPRRTRKTSRLQFLWLLPVLLAVGGWISYQNGYFDDLGAKIGQMDNTVDSKATSSDASQVKSAGPAVVELANDIEESGGNHQAADDVPGETVMASVSTESEDVQQVQTVLYEAHIASFRSRDRAETLASRFRLLTDGVYIRDVQIRGAKWSRVILGPFEDETVAGDWVEKARSVTPVIYFRIAEQPLDTESRE